jgi:hypothetical protein
VAAIFSRFLASQVERGRSPSSQVNYGGHEPEPTLMVKPRDTLPGPLPAVINPTCFATTGEVVTLKAGLTV